MFCYVHDASNALDDRRHDTCEQTTLQRENRCTRHREISNLHMGRSGLTCAHFGQILHACQNHGGWAHSNRLAHAKPRSTDVTNTCSQPSTFAVWLSAQSTSSGQSHQQSGPEAPKSDAFEVFGGISYLCAVRVAPHVLVDTPASFSPLLAVSAPFQSHAESKVRAQPLRSQNFVASFKAPLTSAFPELHGGLRCRSMRQAVTVQTQCATRGGGSSR